MRLSREDEGNTEDRRNLGQTESLCCPTGLAKEEDLELHRETTSLTGDTEEVSS